MSVLFATARRDQIMELERQMLDMDQVEIEPQHFFAEGVYARQIFIPAGTMLTGKIHRTRHLTIVSQGKIAVVTERGEQVIEAPSTFVSEPGTKRAVIALEDTVWTTIHGTDETDLDRIENELIAPNFAALEAPRSWWGRAIRYLEALWRG